jgi:putative FmdB family regulatory protein
MPLYEYKCEKCGEKFEVMQKFADEPVTTHEQCGGKVERLISAPSLQFKGSGFYITDYGKGGAKKPAENGSSQKSDSTPAKPSGSSESGSSTNSAPASSSSTESKPASSSSKSSSSESK